MEDNNYSVVAVYDNHDPVVNINIRNAEIREVKSLKVIERGHKFARNATATCQVLNCTLNQAKRLSKGLKKAVFVVVSSL